MDNLKEMSLSFARIIACDVANEIVSLSKDNKTDEQYNPEVFNYLKQNDNPVFYISDRIDAYDQIDDVNIRIKEDYHNYLLFLDSIPVCIISNNLSNQETNIWSYNIHYLNDPNVREIIDGGNYCLLSALDYGVYLVDNKSDYYTISYPIPDGKDINETLKGLGIVTASKEKNKLDLDLIDKSNLKVNIKDYDYNCITADDITNISNYLKNNQRELLECKIIGPVARYQYNFSSLDSIEVCDFDRENNSYMFILAKDNAVKGYLYYDLFDKEDGINIYEVESVLNNSYFVELANVGIVYEEKIVADKQTYSLLDKLVIKEIQNKIRNDKPSLNIYDLIR